MPQLIKTRFLPPYTPSGKTTFPGRDRCGVYLIQKAGELRYVGMSRSNVYKSLYRHFQTWNDPNGPRVVYKQLHDVRVRVVYTDTAARAVQLERALIIQHRPPDNPDKLERYIHTDAGKAMVRQVEDAAFTPLDDIPF